MTHQQYKCQNKAFTYHSLFPSPWLSSSFGIATMLFTKICLGLEPCLSSNHYPNLTHLGKKHLVAMFWENIRLLCFIQHYFGVNTYWPTIMIYLSIILVKGIPRLALENNTLKRWEIHSHDLLYLSNVT